MQISKLVFLDKLRDSYTQVNPAIMQKIDEDYQFTDSLDPKIKQRWFWLGLIVDYKPVYNKAHEFVSQ